MKLFPKLVLTVSLLLTGTITCLTGCFYWAEQRQLHLDAVQERQAALHSLVHIAQESFLTNDDLLLVKYTGWLAKSNPSITSISVVDPQGSILAHSEPERIGQQVSAFETAGSQVLVMSEPVRMGAHWMGTASAAFSEQALEASFHRQVSLLQRRLAAVAVLSLLIGLCVCLSVASSWSRPIGELAAAAGKVGQGKRDLNLALLSRRRDELGFLSRAFDGMATQLNELDAMKEDFVSAVTHELRSPLGAIESYLNVIRGELPGGISRPAWEMYLERLSVNTQRLTRFVNDLLDVAALERGKIQLALEAVDLAMIAQDVRDLFGVKLAEARLACHIEVPANLPRASADPDKIRQVLMNLISNAIKFTPPGGAVRICFAARPADRKIGVQVIDSGVGIAEADLAKIFDKFEQVHSARKNIRGPKGTGLGLAISKAIMELHGEDLRVTSVVGKGSVFAFSLPMDGAVYG